MSAQGEYDDRLDMALRGWRAADDEIARLRDDIVTLQDRLAAALHSEALYRQRAEDAEREHIWRDLVGRAELDGMSYALDGGTHPPPYHDGQWHMGVGGAPYQINEHEAWQLNDVWDDAYREQLARLDDAAALRKQQGALAAMATLINSGLASWGEFFDILNGAGFTVPYEKLQAYYDKEDPDGQV